MEIFLIFLIMMKHYNNFFRWFVYTNIVGKRCLALNVFFKFLVAFPQKSKENTKIERNLFL